MGRRKIIGICGARLHQQNAIKLISEVKRIGLQYGYITVAVSSAEDSLEDTDEIMAEYEMLELCKYIDLSALILLTETLKNRTLINRIVEIGKEKEIPVFSVDGIVDGCYNMSMDYSTGFSDIMSHLIEEHGVRRINMLAGSKGNSFSEERVNIYKETLEQHGIFFEEERLGYGEFWDRPARVALKKFMDSDLQMPEAIVCANDAMAVTTCSVLSEAGYQVPEDIIVTGFDGSQSGKYHLPKMTTCEPDYQNALHFILEQLEKVEKTGKIEPCDYSIPFVMLAEQSCGCKKKAFSDHNRIISKLYDDVGDSSWHTLAMNQLVVSVFNKQWIEDIMELLPDTVKLWSDNFRFACVKSELMKPKDLTENRLEIPQHFENMTSILNIDHQEIGTVGEQFSVEDFIPNFDEILEGEEDVPILLVRLLNFGKMVYGYIVEGIENEDERTLQRCNEFAMFLAHSINTIHYNRRLNGLNQNLIKAYAEIADLSMRDPMTGIFNRRGFYQNLEKMIKESQNLGKYLYLISIDMDGLKYINDNFGHKEGDFAITAVGKALAELSYDKKICSRFGGDEFMCAILEDEKNLHSSGSVQKQLLVNLQKLPEVQNKEYLIGFSIGLSCSVVDEKLDCEKMILSADQKMYGDKQTRKKK